MRSRLKRGRAVWSLAGNGCEDFSCQGLGRYICHSHETCIEWNSGESETIKFDYCHLSRPSRRRVDMELSAMTKIRVPRCSDACSSQTDSGSKIDRSASQPPCRPAH